MLAVPPSSQMSSKTFTVTSEKPHAMRKSSSTGIDSNSTSSVSLSSDSLSRIRDYAPSSTWSNASTEQSFDAQATIHVQDMLEKLEMYMYKESMSLAGNKLLGEECEEWSLLFPHLRVRGINPSPHKDQGFELLSRDPISDGRPCSPYFYVPECSQSSKSALKMNGIALPNQSIAPRNEKPPPDCSNLANEWQEMSAFTWDDALQDICNGKVQWSILQLKRLKLADNTDARSITPTQDDPHSFRGSGSLISVNVLASGTGKQNSMEALRSALSTSDIDSKDHVFGLALVDASYLISTVSASNDDHLPEGPVICFVHWSFKKDSSHVILMLDADEDDTSETSNSPPGTDKSPVVSDVDCTQILGINVYDVMFHFMDMNASIVEVYAPSLRHFISNPLKIQSFQVYSTRNTGIDSNEDSLEEIFGIDGDVEEYFARDDMDDLDKDLGVSHPSPKKGLFPVSPRAAIRQDIISHLFDDIWTEVKEKFGFLSGA
ncbi:hypothetical protein BC830DRAFT_951173 [Chytriomyces sp. MP71]|nr:hypothetical protein BC830DRAFT_951173 [Chytriomyces sp. MP71]